MGANLGDSLIKRGVSGLNGGSVCSLNSGNSRTITTQAGAAPRTAGRCWHLARSLLAVHVSVTLFWQEGDDTDESHCTSVTVRPEIMHVTIKKKKERWRQACTVEKSHDNNIVGNCHIHVLRKALRSPTPWIRRRPAGYPRCRPSEGDRMFIKSVAVIWWTGLGFFSRVDRLKWACVKPHFLVWQRRGCWSARHPPPRQ